MAKLFLSLHFLISGIIEVKPSVLELRKQIYFRSLTMCHELFCCACDLTIFVHNKILQMVWIPLHTLGRSLNALGTLMNMCGDVCGRELTKMLQMNSTPT